MSINPSSLDSTSRKLPLSASNLPGWLLPLITGIAVFIVYLRTLAPTIVGGDTGEFAAVACSTGVAHPPGYPLFTILAKLFTFIPFGTIGWRINLLSAACDAFAAVILLLAVRRWTRDQWSGFVASGLFAFSPLIWRYAVAAEVFSLNNLIVATMVYLAVRFATEANAKHAYWFALVFGLGIANHLTCLFYGGPLLVWMVVQGRSALLNVRSLLTIAAAFLLGTIPYIYLPLADLFTPAFSWGHTSTLGGFVTHLMRREYGTLQLADDAGTAGTFILGLVEYFKALPRELLYVGVLLAALGFGFRRRAKVPGLITALVIAFCLYLVVFHALANLALHEPGDLRIHSRFWQQANLLMCFWAGLGFASLLTLLPEWKRRDEILAVLGVMLVVATAAYNFRAEDQHFNTTAVDFGREMLRPLPANAIVWSHEDLVTFSLAYLQQCEGYRKDVVVIERGWLPRPWMTRLINANYPRIGLPGAFYGAPRGGYTSKQLFDANRENAYQFANRLETYSITDWSWQSSYELWPYGMLSWVMPAPSQVDLHSYIKQSETALPQLDVGLLSKYPVGSWENGMLQYYWEARLNRAHHLISYGMFHNNDRTALEAGATGLDDMLTRLPLRDASLFKLLGSTYKRLSAYDKAYEEKAITAWKRYLELNPPADDPDLNEIKNAVR